MTSKNKFQDHLADLEKGAGHSKLKTLMHHLASAFKKLGHPIDPLQIESICCVLFQVMNARERRYHNMDHIFQMLNNINDPIGTISTLMHDLIYIQVDKRIHPLLRKYLKDLDQVHQNELVIPALDDDQVNLILKIFDLKPGQKISTISGLNEFLSAVIAVRLLNLNLSPYYLIQLICCIEATIPFRKNTSDGLSVCEVMEKRLHGINKEKNLKLSSREIDQIIHSAVEVSNSDVYGFQSEDLGLFMGQTWLLILEGQPIFRNPLYTVGQYRFAIQNMERFFSTINPDVIPRQYKDKPTPHQFEIIMKQTKFNLKAAAEYMQAKFIATCLVEAIAKATGGDMPMVLILGEEIQEEGRHLAPIERFLHRKVGSTTFKNIISLEAYTVLKFGRATPSSFDFKHAPVTTYLCEMLDLETYEVSLQSSRLFSEGKLSAEELISSFPVKEALYHILNGMAEVSWTRKEGIKHLQTKLFPEGYVP